MDLIKTRANQAGIIPRRANPEVTAALLTCFPLIPDETRGGSQHES
jgi:hypothetical protein